MREAQNIPPEPGLEKGKEAGGRAEANGKEVVLLCHGALVVMEEEVVTRNGNSESSEDGGGQASAGQGRVVFRTELD